MESNLSQNIATLFRRAQLLFNPKRHLPPFIYFIYSIFVWNNYNEHFHRLFLMDFGLIFLLCVKPSIFINFDFATVILFFLWVLENNNREALKEKPDAFDTNGDAFLVFSLYLFKLMLWFMTISMVCFVVYLVVRIIKQIFIRVHHHPSVRGLSEDSRNQLPIHKYKDYCLTKHANQADNRAKHTISMKKEMNELCSICLVDYADQDEVVLMPKCRHLFHKKCIYDWLMNNKICPYCRSPTELETELQPIGLVQDLEAQPLSPQNNSYVPPNIAP